jgi:hypothetical protein
MGVGDGPSLVWRLPGQPRPTGRSSAPAVVARRHGGAAGATPHAARCDAMRPARPGGGDRRGTIMHRIRRACPPRAIVMGGGGAARTSRGHPSEKDGWVRSLREPGAGRRIGHRRTRPVRHSAAGRVERDEPPSCRSIGSVLVVPVKTTAITPRKGPGKVSISTDLISVW